MLSNRAFPRSFKAPLTGALGSGGAGETAGERREFRVAVDEEKAVVYMDEASDGEEVASEVVEIRINEEVKGMINRKKEGGEAVEEKGTSYTNRMSARDQVSQYRGR